MRGGQSEMRILSILSLTLTLLVVSGCTTGREISQNLSPSQTPPFEIQRALANGTALDSLDLSGLKAEEAKTKIQDWEEDKLAQNLLLVYNETEVPVTLKELGIRLDFEKVWARLWKEPGQRIASSLKVDSVQAHQALQEKLTQFTRAAVDASYTIEKDRFVIKPAVPGRSIQTDAVLEQIRNQSFASLPSQVKISVTEIPATVTTDELKSLAFDGVIGEYTTRFNVNEQNRSANLMTAASKLDKIVIKPGETFSYNQTLGPRTLETGYKDAYIIINNEYVQGIGGGICQVSSTLYSAAVLANLPIVERYPHAVAISYIPMGQDATVNYPNLDLKFKNDTASLIYIRSEVKSGSLTLRIYGKKTDKSVRFVHEIVKEIPFKTIRRMDPNLAPGRVALDQTGNKGYVVKTWRVIKDASGAETEQLLGQDNYAPAHRILRVGAD